MIDMGLIRRIYEWWYGDTIRIAGTAGMTLKEYRNYQNKAKKTICNQCQDPHSLRMTDEKTLTCIECGNQQSTWGGEE